jgi:NHLM bacteriocin system ABC transporter ATP-binding protein
MFLTELKHYTGRTNMGLYSDQIAARIKNDTDAFDDAFVGLASVVMGHKKDAQSFLTDSSKAQNAIGEILKYYHIAPAKPPANLKDLDDQLDFLLRPSGVMRRRVELTGSWYKDGIGALLGKKTDGAVVALLPRKTGGYTFYDFEENKRVRVTRQNAFQISMEAYCFYDPLPAKKLAVSDLLVYMRKTLAVSDIISIAAVTLAVTLLGLLLPLANQMLFDSVLLSGKISQLRSVAVLLIGATISTMLLDMTRALIMAKINTKLETSVQSAAMARLLSLPASFFKDYSSGEVTQRLNSLNGLCGTLLQTVIGTGLTTLFSLIYIGQIAALAPALAVPALIIIGLNIALMIGNTFAGMNVAKKQMVNQGKLSGLVYSLFTGVQKIKLAGGERRAFAKWAKHYTTTAMLTFSPPWFLRLGPVITGAVSLGGAVVLFAIAGKASISSADYMAFNVSFGMVSGAMVSLAGLAAAAAGIKPTLDMAKPIMTATPEVAADKKMLTRLTGSIEINNVSFRYSDDMPNVLDDLSLKINKGQYVAIVGASGCGKSTLLRLLLGFETPQTGAVYYDRHDIKTLDLRSLRKHIGCVIQNGRLMSGNIFQNITVSAPWLSAEMAWEAAEMAGIAADIREMPMGMHTMITESGGISGGQRQRLLIARALAGKPAVLILDEATSALDNITQKHVSQSLDKLKCTRIVIAHRLSTIRQCDRVIMLENGRIAEDGTYRDLIAKGGKFAELVARQRLEG